MKSEKGQSMVEFALVLPVLIVLLFGIVDFGRIFHAYLTIDHASREAARSASVGEDDATIRAVAVDNATSINLSGSQVSISPGGKKTSGSEVRITISHNIDFLTPVIASLTGPIDLTSTTAMRVE
ncbi:TadE family protein [Alkalihalobacillus sp. CinArs1]|uniref:TadE family protein n=1 Tax=Alkalihalobacillus sp. CinArs1 TaxID=2995314 RepID=UPI0022DD8DDD|nr:TadE/TadG family type IV pilus assembly protein [Alkalihalobacillus sp. CinArs1]